MFFDLKNTKGKKVKVFDPFGNLIKAATYYDPVSREVEFYATSTKDPLKFACPYGRLIKVRCHMIGSWIEIDGVRY